ncbi:hypothetical protein N601_28670 [Rhodococcus erythropolis DN1]|nr:hypothetical protein N601_28670 [Rhodococcus erythropolis DN1]
MANSLSFGVGVATKVFMRICPRTVVVTGRGAEVRIILILSGDYDSKCS